MAITKGDTVEAPRTKLPYYDLARHGADDPVPAASGFHQTTITASPVFASAPALLQAFAAFVSAVTDLQHVAFVAEYPAENASKHQQQQQQRVLAIASVPGIDQPRQYASDHVHVDTFLEESLDAEVFEFEMQIRSATAGASGAAVGRRGRGQSAAVRGPAARARGRRRPPRAARRAVSRALRRRAGGRIPPRLLDIVEDVRASVVLGVGPVPFPGVDLDDGSAAARRLRQLVWVDITDPARWRAGRQQQLLPSASTGAPALRRPLVAEEDLAYVMYTSGSTGKPKGVLISHAMATCGVNGHAEAFEPLPTGPELRWLQFGMPTFDLSLLEIFLTLGYGGTLCVAERQLLLSDLETMINFFQANAIFIVASLVTLLRPERLPTLKTIISGGEALTPYAIRNFAWDAPLPPPTPPPPSCPVSFGDHHAATTTPTTTGAKARVINIYGATESTMCSTAEIAGFGSRGSIGGQVFSCASVVLVDAGSADALHEVPLGLTGEIVFGGPMIGYGYLNRPAETARAYTSGLGLGPLYRTGDRGRIVWSPDGTPKLEILGRLNMDQVKINSRRVELGEIESAIAKVDAVREVACCVVDGSFLVAYITTHGGGGGGGSSAGDAQMDARTVALACRGAAEHDLPAWMRPAQYVVAPKIPRTSSGKVDRKALQKLAVEQFGTAQGAAAALTQQSVETPPCLPAEPLHVDFADGRSVQRMVQRVVKSVLGNTAEVEDVARPLTSYGLDSLRAMKLLQDLRSLGAGGLALKDVLAGNSIADVTRSILDLHHVAAAADSIPTPTSLYGEDDQVMMDIEDEEEFLSLSVAAKLRHFESVCRPIAVAALSIPSSDIEQVLPTTGLQTRMLINLEEAAELGVAKSWIEHYPYKVPGNIDADRLEGAIVRAMSARDAFRTVCVRADHPLAVFAQCVLSPACAKAALPVVRVECPAFDERPGSLWQRTIANAQRSAEETFGLHSLSSVTTFVRSADRKHCVVVFSMYHAIYDGMSLRLLSRDIVDAYNEIPSAATAAASPEKPGMRAAVQYHFQSDWLATGMFWMSRLAGIGTYQIGSKLLPLAAATAAAAADDAVADAEGTVARSFDSVRSGLGLASETLTCCLSLNELFAETKLRGLPTPMSVIQAAWAMTLSQTMVDSSSSPSSSSKAMHQGIFDLMFGSVFHGRQTAESMDVFALMLDGLPTYITLSRSQPMTHRQICAALFEQYTSALAHTEMPCTTVQFAKATRRFDTTIILQAFPAFDDDTEVEGFPAFSRQHDGLKPWKETSADTPILVEIWPGRDRANDKLSIRCSYSEVWPGYEFMTPEWIRGLVATFDRSLAQIIGNPDGVFDPVQAVSL
ncbi:AMP-dependent synthetase/ligase [Moelleriella libera RCEF 2490]|uniref:AMP-dependent synthetase/ligase n=1 Tax=Moelleriella libera RCEF 2490 TaxID=1081109 RepID=A0A168EL80_9HYPO|nr:AMP-dependent synthetase/ligase [Moelleriella libera RCEF 2490]